MSCFVRPTALKPKETFLQWYKTEKSSNFSHLKKQKKSKYLIFVLYLIDDLRLWSEIILAKVRKSKEKVTLYPSKCSGNKSTSLRLIFRGKTHRLSFQNKNRASFECIHSALVILICLQDLLTEAFCILVRRQVPWAEFTNSNSQIFYIWKFANTLNTLLCFSIIVWSVTNKKP